MIEHLGMFLVHPLSLTKVGIATICSGTAIWRMRRYLACKLR